MEPGHPENSAQPDERIASLINEYFDRRQSDEDLTPESFAAEHPDLAEQLRPYLEGLSLLEEIRPMAGVAAGTQDTADTDTRLPVIEGYKLLEELGRGGMGVVYKALQVSTKRVVALKVMSGGPFASESALRRFDREVELAARLQHSGIVRILESGQVAAQKYYAMDFVEGVRLDRYLATAQPDVRTTLGVFEHVCRTVDYAHQHGVIHRDLKPANVLIDDEGDPHILDFGLAKATDQGDVEEALTTCVSIPGQVMGTLPYLSPEQAAGMSAEIDTRTDIYSLGVMMFEALTGSLPVDTTGRPTQVIQRILETPPIPPSSLSNRVDDELETIILKSLEKDKVRRYQCAEEMAEDIRRYLEGEPILAKRPSSFYFLRKKMLKHRLGVALGAAAVALSLIGLVAGIRWRQQELAQARRSAVQLLHSLEILGAGAMLGGAEALRNQHPKLLEPLLALAQTQHRSGRPERAILELERDLQRDPSRWACRALLAEVYRASGNARRADALQAQADREAPDTAEAWYLRSLATLDPRRALRYAQEAVIRQPSHALARRRLAHLRWQFGDLEGALEDTEKLIELRDDPAYWIRFKGHILARQRRFQEAIRQFTRAGAYLQRAHTYRRLKEYGKAVADYTELLERRGEATAVVWMFHQRATSLWILGRTDEALEDYRRVRIRLGRPFYSDACRFLILADQGRQREAEQVLATALRDVHDPWLRRIFRCLSGQLTPDELVADALARDNLEQLCEAFYYAGERCLLSDNPTRAREWFEKCVQTGLDFDPDTELGTPMNEYELAQWRLESLPATPPAPRSEKN